MGRLIADPDHETVEYAVLIADAWQKKELGKLSDRVLPRNRPEVESSKRVVAVTTTDNRPMISVFEKLGFEINYETGDSTVEVSKMIS